MSRDATIIEISSESDSDNECNANYPFDGISKIELIKDETDTIDDDDVQIVSITQLAPEPVAARTKPGEPIEFSSFKIFVFHCCLPFFSSSQCARSHSQFGGCGEIFRAEKWFVGAVEKVSNCV